MRVKRAFTLIELLVVIAIIALLLSIVIPSMKKAKEQAKKTICQSHLKQWGVIYEMYLNDNNGYYPVECQDGSTQPFGAGTWYYVMQPYYEDLEILLCPASISAPVPKPSYFNSRWRWVSGWWTQFPLTLGSTENAKTEGSFGQNWWVTSSKGGSLGTTYPDANKWKKKGSIPSPSLVPVVGDCGAFLTRPTEDAPPPFNDGDYSWVSGDEMRRVCTNRHNTGGVNWIFADGSLNHIKLKQLWKVKWHRNWVPRNIVDWPEWMQSLPDE